MSLRLKSMAALLVAVATLSVAFAACGGSSKKSESTSPTTAPGAAASATKPPAGGGANNISIADFSFTPGRFNAVAGQQVSLTVSNTGQQPHTFTITGVVDSGTISPGQTKTVTFTPAQAGNLVYFCTIHGQARMSGQVMVSATSGSLPPAPDSEMAAAVSDPAY